MTQGIMIVAEYYTKLKMLWDELLCSVPIPKADNEYETSKELVGLMFSSQLMEFLVGLHDRFDLTRNQILLLEPLPSVNKAFSMATRVEKEMDISNASKQ